MVSFNQSQQSRHYSTGLLTESDKAVAKRTQTSNRSVLFDELFGLNTRLVSQGEHWALPVINSPSLHHIYVPPRSIRSLSKELDYQEEDVRVFKKKLPLP